MMAPRAYYNEIEPYCCAWLSNLMDRGLITPGHIDDRSIEDVKPEDVRGYQRVHWFAGIGGWDYALTLAGWGERDVWTGSCPCQPFSANGQGKGFADARHLWPVWRALIKHCRPSVVFGEQVDRAVRHGWLDLIYHDLENMHYACGAVVLPACSVGAPHLRQRLWFVAEDALGDAESERRRRGEDDGYQGRRERALRQAGALTPWASGQWVECSDGKARLVEPSIQPMAHGIPKRVARLRAIGNAIVPHVAAAFIRAYMAPEG